MITKYNGLSDEELLRHLESRDRTASPLLQELIIRFQHKMEHPDVASNDHVECPVCEASLIVDTDLSNDLYNLKVNKDD